MVQQIDGSLDMDDYQKKLAAVANSLGLTVQEYLAQQSQQARSFAKALSDIPLETVEDKEGE